MCIAMKKIFLFMLSYLWGLTVGVPSAFKFVYGKYPRCYPELGNCPEEYMMYAAIIMSVFTIAGVLLIWVMPIGKQDVVAELTISTGYL